MIVDVKVDDHVVSTSDRPKVTLFGPQKFSKFLFRLAAYVEIAVDQNVVIKWGPKTWWRNGRPYIKLSRMGVQKWGPKGGPDPPFKWPLGGSRGGHLKGGPTPLWEAPRGPPKGGSDPPLEAPRGVLQGAS